MSITFLFTADNSAKVIMSSIPGYWYFNGFARMVSGWIPVISQVEEKPVDKIETDF